jgi:hypothetical protein
MAAETMLAVVSLLE